MIADLLIRFFLWLARHTPPRYIPDRKTETWHCRLIQTFRPGDVFGYGVFRRVVTHVTSPHVLEVAPVYLTRWFLTRRSRFSEGMEAVAAPPRWGLYLHRFSRGDHDQALHSHPWKWAVSLVLKGGYSEERRYIDKSSRTGFGVFRRQVCPWSLNFLKGESFHRVDLNNGDCWSLFLVGPLTDRGWGFWDRKTGRYTPHAEFLGHQL